MSDVATLLLIIGGLAVLVLLMGLAGRHRSRATNGDSGAMIGPAGFPADCSPGGFGGSDCGGSGGDGGGGA